MEPLQSLNVLMHYKGQPLTVTKYFNHYSTTILLISSSEESVISMLTESSQIISYSIPQHFQGHAILKVLKFGL